MEIVDPVKVFNQIDRDGAGMVLFEEFVEFALEQELDMEDDDGQADQENLIMNRQQDLQEQRVKQKVLHKLGIPQTYSQYQQQQQNHNKMDPHLKQALK